ncbi:MAG: hypothetical protein Sylvanvirus12_19 [Sylvanvirus sp.]|uniref:F-box domain-containing protein n=1 Tax=Sylvanvirus sp. TaxID=2487774 RepID=A0A3G5AI50_9VIRU|nr:MAG: hypothetical protein Sylvanvirus12_19 [Sylvanvirus sp.]
MRKYSKIGNSSKDSSRYITSKYPTLSFTFSQALYIRIFSFFRVKDVVHFMLVSKIFKHIACRLLQLEECPKLLFELNSCKTGKSLILRYFRNHMRHIVIGTPFIFLEHFPIHFHLQNIGVLELSNVFQFQDWCKLSKGFIYPLLTKVTVQKSSYIRSSLSFDYIYWNLSHVPRLTHFTFEIQPEMHHFAPHVFYCLQSIQPLQSLTLICDTNTNTMEILHSCLEFVSKNHYLSTISLPWGIIQSTMSLLANPNLFPALTSLNCNLWYESSPQDYISPLLLLLTQKIHATCELSAIVRLDSSPLVNWSCTPRNDKSMIVLDTGTCSSSEFAWINTLSVHPSFEHISLASQSKLFSQFIHIHTFEILFYDYPTSDKVVSLLTACEELPVKLRSLTLPDINLSNHYDLVGFFSRFTNLTYLKLVFSCGQSRWYTQRFFRVLTRLATVEIQDREHQNCEKDTCVTQYDEFVEDLPLSIVKLHLQFMNSLKCVSSTWHIPLLNFPHLLCIRLPEYEYNYMSKNFYHLIKTCL